MYTMGSANTELHRDVGKQIIRDIVNVICFLFHFHMLVYIILMLFKNELPWEEETLFDSVIDLVQCLQQNHQTQQCANING